MLGVLKKKSVKDLKEGGSPLSQGISLVPSSCSAWWEGKLLFEISILGGIRMAKKRAKHLRGFRNPEPNTSPVPKSWGSPFILFHRATLARTESLCCLCFFLYVGSGGDLEARSSRLWRASRARMPSLLCQELQWARRLEQKKDEKAQQPHSAASRSTTRCRWLHVEGGSAGPWNGSPTAATGHLLFSLLSLCACARASDYSDYLTVFGLSTSTPPTPL